MLNSDTVRQVRQLTGMGLKEAYDFCVDSVRRHLDPIQEGEKLRAARAQPGSLMPSRQVLECQKLLGLGTRDVVDYVRAHLAQGRDPVEAALVEVREAYLRDRKVKQILANDWSDTTKMVQIRGEHANA